MLLPNVPQLYPKRIFYCWTLKSIESFNHVQLLETPIKMKWFNTFMLNELQEDKH